MESVDMETYFRIRYEFSKDEVHRRIREAVSRREAGYICVADGNVLTHVQHNPEYWRIVYDSMFAICDSGWVPLYLRLLYGIRREQYCGAQIFQDIVSSEQYRMAFLGTDDVTLQALREKISSWNPQVQDMFFMALPYREVDEFDYLAIAEKLNQKQIDIIWVALGAPKQEQFMNRLRPFLKQGVMLGVGAVFNFYSGRLKRAPQWLVSLKLEFAYRILTEPGKQIVRCKGIVKTLPLIFRIEKDRKLIAKLTRELQSLQSRHIEQDKAELITAFGQSPEQLDSLLETCESHPETHFTIITDDARFWQLPANVNIVPVASNQY